MLNVGGEDGKSGDSIRLDDQANESGRQFALNLRLTMCRCSAANASRKAKAISGCAAMPPASSLAPSAGSVTDASCTRSADMTKRVSLSAASACTARADAFSTAVGLWTNASHPTTQSNAFFMTPVTPCAYSGLAINTPSAALSCSRNARTGAGNGYSVSGLNRGNSPRRANGTRVTPTGAKAVAAASNAVLMDAARRLPETVRIRMVFNTGLPHRMSVPQLQDQKSQRPEQVGPLLCSGGADGTRTRDPRRDRPVF